MKKRHWLCLLTLSLLVMTLFFSCQSAPEATVLPELPTTAESAGAQVKLYATAETIGVTDQVEVTAWIENVETLYGMELWFEFDTARLTLLDAEPEHEGLQITPGDFLQPDFVLHNEGWMEDGRIVLVVTQISPREPVSGSGILATLHFEATQFGPANITWQEVLLASPHGEQIPVQPHAVTLMITE